MKLDVVIVNWNAGDLLSQCLESIRLYGKERVERIVIVDNASRSGWADDMDTSGLALEIIQNPINHGFAAACNQGAVRCHSKYILFLNPDTRILEHTFDKAMAFMESAENREVGICGVQLIDESGQVARSCSRFPTLSRFLLESIGLTKVPMLRSFGMRMSEWEHDSDRAVDQVIGAFFLTRRALFAELGGFDEAFFVYFEEVDFSLRARQRGWKTAYVAGTQAFHRGGGTTMHVVDVRLFYSLRSRLVYGCKHFSRAKAWGLLVLTILVEPPSRLVFSLLQRERRGFFSTFSGFRMLYRDLPGLLKKHFVWSRKQVKSKVRE